MKMKKKYVGLISILMAFFITATGCGSSSTTSQSGQKPIVRASLQPCLHGLPSWLAIEDGWIKDSPINLELVFFKSGAPQNEALAANQWDVGAMGTVPSILASIRYNAYMVGISNDESETNDLWVKPDSPLLKTKGFNPKYPEIYGSADDWKGKKILVTTVSTGAYALGATLKDLGLTDKDVKMINMDQGQAITAFESNQADIVQLWAPYSYIAEAKGWVKVSSGKRAGVSVPGALLVRKDFADKNPELVVEWLDLYMRGIDYMKKDPAGANDWLFKFYNDYCGLDLGKELVSNDLKLRPLLDVNEQIKALEDPTIAKKSMTEITQFLVEQGQLTAADKAKYENGNFVEPKFMKMLAEKRAKVK